MKAHWRVGGDIDLLGTPPPIDFITRARQCGFNKEMNRPGIDLTRKRPYLNNPDP